MFKLFRRQAPAARPSEPADAAAAPAPASPARTPVPPEAPPQLEVREDHDESAWDLWEQSNFQLDSQMGGLAPSDSVRVREARPSQDADLDDPFSRVGKHHR
ncbi:hypothetical protein PE066_00115 [Ramlibacter tataouinensis]|uniref:hypothetical protein n=1 Tax=Ramlibacter tataouinensis TaxID=94132 RepID=UPI0022F3EF85|nr:hypothetical protein [Ramlibacter tataouinensis]WBY01982.1 hypothetical protein PE066_00115 [Ramlibacter tataouinensis]